MAAKARMRTDYRVSRCVRMRECENAGRFEERRDSIGTERVWVRRCVGMQAEGAVFFRCRGFQGASGDPVGKVGDLG